MGNLLFAIQSPPRMILWHYVTQRRSLPCYINLPSRGGRFAPVGWPISSGMVAVLLWNMQNMNKSQIPILLEAKERLEVELNVSGEEIAKLKTGLRERILDYRVPTISDES